jgi:hypothetical protein
MAIAADQKNLLFKRPRKGLWFLVLGASLLVHFLIFVMPLQLSKGTQYNQENPQTILTVTFAKTYKPTIPQTHSPPATPRVSYASSLPHAHKPANTRLQKLVLIPKSTTQALAVEALPDSRPKLDIAKIAGAVEHEVKDMENEQATDFIPRDNSVKQDNVDRNLASLKADRKEEKRTQPNVMRYADGMIKYRTVFGSVCFKPIPDAINSNLGNKYTAGMGCQ